jgi:chromosome segregation protein
MRLRKINLSGFKSFVDPTVIDLPSDLVAIVGPNGCGKSNVIDAVRWVMGEISARHLRGDSMADVIFNGSSARKPVSKASVELVFDNTEGRLGERYASYTEISVRRQVSRDGTSIYYMNGAKCRRRDITDLFLGTGLGPRSYAVIEQGMISRLIEARPEELREYLEEVAGISRYKERRRETENRMRHTREHLERLSDVREELGKQLQRLDRQARQAERYKVLKAEERTVDAELLALRWRRLSGETAEQERSVQSASTAVEGTLANLRATESELERGRDTQREASEAANTAYRGVLDVSATVARTEESIDNLKRQRTQVEAAIARERAALGEAEQHQRSDEAQATELANNLSAAEPSLASLEGESNAAQVRYSQAEKSMQEWQARWEELAARAQGPGATAHAERARIESLEERLQRLKEREERVQIEHDGLRPADARAQSEAAQTAATEARMRREEAEEALETARVAVGQAREVVREQAGNLHSAREQQQQLKGAFASLSALQEEALGRNDGAAMDWLRQHGLGDAARLAEGVRVQPGWERAVEVVLGARLEAVIAPQLASIAASMAQMSEVSMTVVDTSSTWSHTPPEGSLGHKVDGPACIHELLRGAQAAATVEDATARAERLGAGEFFVTQSGFCIGRGWMHAAGPEAGHDGVLSRAERLRELEVDLAASEERMSLAESAQTEAQSGLRREEDVLTRIQSENSQVHRIHAAAEAEVANRARELVRIEARRAEVETEMGELGARREVDTAELGASRARLGEATETLEQVEIDRAQWGVSRTEARAELDGARTGWQKTRDEAYQLGLQVEGWRSRVAALTESRMRFGQERGRLENHLAELNEQFETTAEPIAQAQTDLNTALTAHGEAEVALRTARQTAETVEARMRELEAARLDQQNKVEGARHGLEEIRLKAREAAVRRDTIREQLEGDEFNLEAVVEALPEDASESGWVERTEELAKRISRLGAINLAAIDEHKELDERKTYLDAQAADLEEALATLEAAITRIDRETRARFKETYEKVNRGIAERFPKLFGGGQAYLQLSGEDLLTAGVSVMAQPPGKRNSTIALLSGGEKALTAVALVFALFDLNPAPFCLLDEVDAPLDDANVGRFGNVVREMAEHVQMLVVTHNKATMELGQQLVGVTMHEPGVSRLVAVDIDAAVAMVGS